MQKEKNKIIFPLVCLVMKIKNQTLFVDLLLLLNSKIFRYALIKYFDRFMTNIKYHVKNIFVDIAYNASLAQRY